MYIKRNIKKFNNSNTAATTATAVIPAPQTIKSSGLGRYKLPTCDEVPAGPYFSEVVSARFKTTNSGKSAIEVMYDIKNGYTCKKIAIGKLPPNTPNEYHIKQIYPDGTPYYEDFVDSMTEALGLKYGTAFTLDDIKGVTEFIKISYNSYSDLGGIEERCPLSWDEFMDLCAPQTVQQDSSTEDNPSEHNDENDLEEYDDEEYDDFLDEE